MSIKRHFVLSVAAMLVITAAFASAQSAGSWTKSSNGSVAGKAPATSAPSQETSVGAVPRLEGTWQVTQDFGDHSDVGLYTFGAGADANHGIVVWEDQFVFTANPSCVNGQGGWERTAGHTYNGTQISFCFDAFNGFVPAGYLKIRYTVTTNPQGNSLAGNSVFEGYDADGHLVFTANATLQGTRMAVEGAQ